MTPAEATGFAFLVTAGIVSDQATSFHVDDRHRYSYFIFFTDIAMVQDLLTLPHQTKSLSLIVHEQSQIVLLL